MPTPVVDRTTAPLPVAPPAMGLTPRGVAAARLGGFQDAWDQLAADDRAWFAEWLRDLLVDACLEAPERS